MKRSIEEQEDKQQQIKIRRAILEALPAELQYHNYIIVFTELATEFLRDSVKLQREEGDGKK